MAHLMMNRKPSIRDGWAKLVLACVLTFGCQPCSSVAVNVHNHNMVVATGGTVAAFTHSGNSLVGELSGLNQLRPDSSFHLETVTDKKGEALPSNMTGFRLNANGDTRVLRSSLIVSSVGALVAMFAFCILRRFFTTLYVRPSVEDQQVIRPVEVGLTDWITKVLDASAEDEVQRAGLDGWAFLEFYRLNFRLLTMIAPIVLATLCPLHYWSSLSNDNDAEDLDLLSRLDLVSARDDIGVFWVHAGFVWFVILVATQMLHSAHQDFLDRRFEWLKAIPHPRATTVMVENIPEHYRSDQDLKDYFGSLFKQENVERAYIVRKTHKLQKKVAEFEQARYALALARRTWENCGQPPLPAAVPQIGRSTTAEVDMLMSVGDKAAAAVVRMVACMRRWDETMHAVVVHQREIESGVARRDPKICSASGFVTFTNELTQRLAQKEQLRRDVTEMAMGMPPDPADVVYENLAVDELGSATWDLLGGLALLAIFLFWTPLVVFISGWTNLTAIKQFMPDHLHAATGRYPGAESLLEGVMATAVLKLFLAFLPSLLLGIISRFSHLKAGALAQLRLQRWYFSFLIVLVLLVITIGRGVIVTFTALVKAPTETLSVLTASLPSASHFYFSYVILGWFTMAFELLRITNLIKYWFFRLVYSLEPMAAKHFSEPEDQASYGMGARMALAVLMSAITMVFCTCSPLVTLFAWIYFGLGRLTFGYLLVFAESKKPDLGGEFWVESLKQVFVVLLLYVLFMFGVLVARCGDWMGPPLLAAGSLLALYLGWRRVHVLAWESLPLEEVVKASRAKEGVHDRLNGKYIQPECDPDLVVGDWREGQFGRTEMGNASAA